MLFLFFLLNANPSGEYVRQNSILVVSVGDIETIFALLSVFKPSMPLKEKLVSRFHFVLVDHLITHLIHQLASFLEENKR